MRVYSKQKVDPVLVTPEVAAELLSITPELLARLVEVGEIPTRPVGKETLIPYKSLLIFAGVARWKFQEVITAGDAY
jgi:hypothetical protein